MLEYSDGLDTDFIILASSSGGFRVGAWDGLRWQDVFPIYEDCGKYKIELEGNETKPSVVCCGIVIYRGTPQEYVSLVSIEAGTSFKSTRRYEF